MSGSRMFVVAAEGPPPRTDRDAVQLIGDASEQGAEMVVIPAERLDADFFDLKTRIAGEVLQKFVTYKMRVVIVGDIAAYTAVSKALRDFVVECNRGSDIGFVDDLRGLDSRLAEQAQPSIAPNPT